LARLSDDELRLTSTEEEEEEEEEEGMEGKHNINKNNNLLPFPTEEMEKRGRRRSVTFSPVEPSAIIIGMDHQHHISTNSRRPSFSLPSTPQMMMKKLSSHWERPRNFAKPSKKEANECVKEANAAWEKEKMEWMERRDELYQKVLMKAAQRRAFAQIMDQQQQEETQRERHGKDEEEEEEEEEEVDELVR
jgi:hypothetical protein